ncbi:MAG: metallophosphoesterase, partial [Planctomycetota bacterium]
EKIDYKQVETVWYMLEKLEAEYGVYSILGNHDHWFNFNKSLEYLNISGQNIRHKAVSINKDGTRIWLGGAGDLWSDDIGIDKAFKNVPDGECKILLAHNPDTADKEFKTRIDLMISGHTHGGQVNLPLIGPLVLPVKNRRYSNGFIRSQHTDIFISRGIGWAIIPVRFNCYPEIAVLNLKKAQG